MAHIPCPHSARLALTFVHTSAAIQCEMTFVLNDATDGIFADPALTCSDFYTAAVAHLVPALDAEVTLTGVVYEDVRTVPYGGADFPQIHHGGTSSAGGSALPTDSALAIKRTSSTLGRSGRGRLFWPVWMAGELSGIDTVDPTRIANYVSALADFQTAVEAALTPAKLGILSTVTGGAPRVSGLFQQTVSWAAIDGLIDSQRRRLLGRGR